MLPPRPLTDLPQLPVTGGIALMALVFTGAKYAGYSTDLLVTGEATFWQHPWTLLTSALPHGGIIHLVFNLYWLWVFGSLLETTLGKAKTLALVLLLAAGSDAAQYALSVPGIGLSGVGYGLFGFLYMLGRRDRRFRDAVDARTAQFFVGWFLFCIVATHMEVMNIANVAHGAGAVLGGVMGVATIPASGWTKRSHGRARWVAGFAAVSLLLGSVGAAAYLRPQVNLSSSADNEAFRLALQASKEGRQQDAKILYQRAIALDADDADSWFNLAIVHLRLHELDESLAAFERSYELNPEPETQKAVGRAHARIGNARLDAERYDEALECFDAALARDERNMTAVFNRGIALERLGRQAEAQAAFRHAAALFPDNDKFRDAAQGPSSPGVTSD